MEQRICISSTGEDFEAWFPVPKSDAEMRECIDSVKPLMVWDYQHPAQVELWPNVLGDYRIRFGWPTK